MLSRRSLLTRAFGGLGSIALADLMQRDAFATGGLPGLPHFAPKAKRVLWMFQSGGASQLESFDYKPLLNKNQGQELPDSIRGNKDKPLPGMSGNQSSFPLVGSQWKFNQHGNNGAWVSELYPHTAKIVDDLCIIRSMYSEAINHDPAMSLLQSGSTLPGRPSAGAWLSYGLGSQNDNLPGFIVLVSKRPADQPLSSRLWDSGFLPTQFQGVQFRAGKDPVLFLNDPKGMPRELTRRSLDGLRNLHQLEQAIQPDPAIEARIAQYEMAFRMQKAVPDAVDVSAEPEHIFEKYGPDAKTPGSFAANCILARRLIEKGVRFVQLYHPGWDQHGGMQAAYPIQTTQTDQPAAALVQDLKERGLLEETLVIWGTEFGRTCYSQGHISHTGDYGREHHCKAFTFWMAGGGVKPGIVHGETDELGFNVVKDGVHVNDFHATLLHLLGIDHERMTYRFQGRDYRLTDVAGNVVKAIIA
ncbi:MAG: DUF1501 domain-containing protein [Verrucomicrobiaceae bacterium]